MKKINYRYNYSECRKCPTIGVVFPLNSNAAFGGLFPYIVREFIDPTKLSLDLYFSDLKKNKYWIGYYTGRPLYRNNYILFSLSYELDYHTMIRSLIDNDIEPFRDKRRGSPLIIVGGPAVTGNPRPLDYIADIAVIGEAEPFLKELPNYIEEYGDNVNELIENLVKIPGVYSSKIGNIVYRSWIRDLNSLKHPLHQYEVDNRELVYGYGLRVEATRGCYRSCSFCMEGHIFVPFRFRNSKVLIDIIEKGLNITSVDRVVFFSLSLFDNPEIDKVLEWMINNRIKASIPSLRLETVNYDRLEMIRMLGQKTLTIAPETASEKIGCLIRKPYSADSLIDVSSRALNIGIQTIKLYYILGFPGECDDDALRIAYIANSIVEKSRIKRRRTVYLSINPLIPKPQTPLQWYRLIDKDEYSRKINIIRKALYKKYIDIEFLDYKIAFITAVIGLGGSELSNVLVSWAMDGGSLYSSFQRSLNKFNIKPEYIYRGRSIDEELPWNIIKDTRTLYFKSEYQSKFA